MFCFFDIAPFLSNENTVHTKGIWHSLVRPRAHRGYLPYALVGTLEPLWSDHVHTEVTFHMHLLAFLSHFGQTTCTQRIPSICTRWHSRATLVRLRAHRGYLPYALVGILEPNFFCSSFLNESMFLMIFLFSLSAKFSYRRISILTIT